MFFNLLPRKSFLQHSLVSVKILICTLFVFAAVACSDSSSNQANAQVSTARSLKTQIPKYAVEVLRYVREHNSPPDGYVGGRRFGNYEKRLPQKTSSGILINYREWDVLPKIKNKSRGAERLVTGSDRSAWYTSDHYSSFTPIK